MAKVGAGALPKTGETAAAKRTRAVKIYERLRARYSDAQCSLQHDNPLQLLVATILSAQCTDERVNIVTKDLFKEFKTARDYVEKPRRQLEKMIQSCGFYRQKAKSIVSACKDILDKHGGQVPQTLEELTQLHGVGRKTANVVLGTAFGVPGIAVDTHCKRIAKRLGFTKQDDPIKIEFDLMKVWPKETWSLYSHLMVFHGRAVCHARTPKCSQCPVSDLCPFPRTKQGKAIAR